MQVNITSYIENINFENLPQKIDFLHFDLKDTPEVFETEYLSKGFKSTLGRFTVEHYQQNPYFHLKTTLETKEVDTISESETTHLKANSRHNYINLEMFIMCLWFVKDNCSYLGGFHSYIPDVDMVIDINNVGNIYCNSKGHYNEKANFSNEDLNRVFKYYIKCNEASSHSSIKVMPKGERTEVIQNLTSMPYDYKKSTRIERAIQFLRWARATSSLHQKISFYMCIYESLFSPFDKGEISHTIAERVALYYGWHPIHRKNIYKQIKDAYGIRSTYFHGQSFTGKTYNKTDFEEVSFRLDALTREILAKVILEDSDIFSQSTEKLEESFRDLIFYEREEYGLTIESKPEYIRFRHLKWNEAPI